MKQCYDCLEHKPLDAYYRGRNQCKPCAIAACAARAKLRAAEIAAYQKQYRDANLAKLDAQRKARESTQEKQDMRRAYREKNRAKRSEQRKAWHQANRETELAKTRAWREANKERARRYIAENRADYTARAAKRRSALKQAIPPWVDFDKISAIYKEAELLRQIGIDIHVDHEIPLVNDIVCGLHVHDNLRIILASENLSKNNKFEYDPS